MAIAISFLSSFAVAVPSSESAFAMKSASVESPPAEDPMTPLPDLATATSTSYALTDGGIRTEIHSDNINYKDSRGNWAPIDGTFIPSPGDAWAAENAENAFEVKLPSDAAVTPVSFSNNDNWIKFHLRGIEGAPDLSNDSAEYAMQDANQTLTLESLPDGLKETIELETVPNEAQDYVYDITLSPDLKPEISPDGEMAIWDSATKRVFTVKAPFMYDSSQDPATSEALKYALQSVGDQTWRLTMTPSSEWLASPDREYPVFIDPTVSIGATTNCWLNESVPQGGSCGGDYLRVGRAADGKERRALLKFDVSQIPSSATIGNAELSLWLDSAQTSNPADATYEIHNPSSGWSARATWSSPDGVNSWLGGGADDAVWATKRLDGSSSAITKWDISELVAWWVHDASNDGLLLRQAQAAANSVVYFGASSGLVANRRPTLVVDYYLGELFDVPTQQTIDRAILNCMIQHGEVPSRATVATTLGTYDAARNFTPGTAPVTPSLGCSNGGFKIVMDTLESKQAADSAQNISTTEDSLHAVEDSLMSELLAGKPVSKVAQPVEQPPTSPSSPEGYPTYPRFVSKMNHRRRESGSDFIKHWYGKDPSYFDWYSDECTSPLGDSPYDFHWPCRRHDFGYQNLRRGEAVYGRNYWRMENEAAADGQFGEDMVQRCHNATDSSTSRGICIHLWAGPYEVMVRRYGGDWDTRGVERRHYQE